MGIRVGVDFKRDKGIVRHRGFSCGDVPLAFHTLQAGLQRPVRTLNKTKGEAIMNPQTLFIQDGWTIGQLDTECEICVRLRFCPIVNLHHPTEKTLKN